MKRAVQVALLCLVLTVAAGCARATTACSGPANTICINGNRISFDGAVPAPHVHEAGSLYVPVDVLAGKLHLDVRTLISADGKRAEVTVNGKPFAPAMADKAKGVHVHDGHVFVPVREFAEAAGIKLSFDAVEAVAGFAK